MPATRRRFPCPWCHGRDFGIVQVFLEITAYGRRFDAVTCKSCGHTALFTCDPPDRYHQDVTVEAGAPYR
jgi:hypothetical protein